MFNITCCNKKFTILHDSGDKIIGSKYIQDVINLSNGGNVTIPIPDRYCT